MLKSIILLSFCFCMGLGVINAMEPMGSSILINPIFAQEIQQYKDRTILSPGVIKGLEQFQKQLFALDPLDKKKDWAAGVLEAWNTFKACFFTSYNDPAIMAQFDLDNALKYLNGRLIKKR